MSEVVTERKKPGPKPKVPKVSVLDRRLASPFGAPSVAITLNTPGLWAIRVANTSVRAGRVHDMTANKGWTFVEASELDGRPDELGFRVQDGRLVRGERGEEVLMKMPQADFDAIVDAKARVNLRALGKKDETAQRVAQQFGAEAGETVYNRINIADTRAAEPELETEDA